MQTPIASQRNIPSRRRSTKFTLYSVVNTSSKKSWPQSVFSLLQTMNVVKMMQDKQTTSKRQANDKPKTNLKNKKIMNIAILYICLHYIIVSIVVQMSPLRKLCSCFVPRRKFCKPCQHIMTEQWRKSWKQHRERQSRMRRMRKRTRKRSGRMRGKQRCMTGKREYYDLYIYIFNLCFTR
mgnify:CR=1 FL=1